jgi:hypothetical protein
LSSAVGLQAGSELSERAPAEEYLEGSPPGERERKHLAESVEIAITGTNVAALNRSPRVVDDA